MNPPLDFRQRLKKLIRWAGRGFPALGRSGVAFAAAGVFQLLLQPETAVLLLWQLLAVGTVFAFLAQTTSGRLSLVFRIAETVLVIGLVVFLINYALLFPVDVYWLWFDRLAAGESTGVLSSVFFYAAGIGTWAVTWSLQKDGAVKNVVAVLAFTFLLAGVVFRSPLFIGLAITSLAILILLNTILKNRPGTPPGLRRRWAVLLPLLFVLAACGALLLWPFQSSSGVPLSRVNFFPGFSGLVVQYLPFLPTPDDREEKGALGREKIGQPPQLAPSVLYQVQGRPRELIYFREQIYDAWDHSRWYRTLAPEALPFPENRLTFTTKITYLGEYLAFLPTTLDTFGAVVYDSQGREKPGAYQDGVLREPLTKGESWELLRYKRGPYSIPVTTPWLQVPEMPSRVKALAAEFVMDDPKPLVLLHRITSFLVKSYLYSFKTTPPPLGGDLVEHFLFDEKKGYSTQFATAFTLLCRMAGLPARFVTGHYSRLDRRGRDKVTGLQAHSWPEVYLEDQGWTIWEVTPVLLTSEPFSVPGEWEEAVRKQIGALTKKNRPQTPEAVFNPILAASGISAVLVVLALVVLIWTGAFRPRTRIDPPFRRLRRLSVPLVRQARKLGVSGPETLGWNEWGHEVSRSFEALRLSGPRAAKIIARAAFHSDGRLEARDIRFLKAVRKRMRIGPAGP